MPSVVRVQVTVVGVDFNAVEAELPKVATIVAAPVFANVTFEPQFQQLKFHHFVQPHLKYLNPLPQ